MSGTSGSVRSSAAAAGAAVAALVLLTACGGGSGGSGGGPEPESSYSAVVAAAEPPPAEGFTPVEVEGIKINAPKNWSVDNTGGTLCMRPPGQDGCGYGAIQVLPHVAENDPNKWPRKQYDAANGWASTPDKCRSLTTAAAADVGVAGAEKVPVDDPQGLAQHADGLKSHHRVWEVTCQNDDTFEVRLWFLPQSDVAVYVWSVDAQYSTLYDEVAASMDVTAYNDR
ncbi:hypothetical protein HNR12_002071 [Streptomonospora nanhaiensis]|uniref:DUF3558 domain-containing protein n=1 Tax=Streptomonospora nanhaiensis TaxID=1323731 RepID=A0A853BM80_9ACTN|nr:hypothetical protein [Streptomonospora nanhaiensis]NYI95794.1 hypothetical protein [Streptomonospora nanhaiensis]